MAENYEYQRPRTRKPREQKHIKKQGVYFKKLIRQIAFSVILFMLLCPPSIIGTELSGKIRSAAKSALTYKIDTDRISESLSKLFKLSAKKQTNETEVTTDENAPQNSENL